MSAPQTFGITYDTVRRHFFPQISAWSPSTNPTQATVTEEVLWKAGDLDGALRTKNIDPTSVVASSAAYNWCAQTLALMVASKVGAVMAQADPAVLKRWQAELKGRLDNLREIGVSALGDGATASDTDDSPDGPTEHIDEYGLTIGDTSDMSTSEPIFRRDDVL